MNKLVFIFLFLGTTFLLNAQSNLQTEELTKLKKQINELKAKNVKLEKLVKYNSLNFKKLGDSLHVQLQSTNSELLTVKDSLESKERIIKNTKTRTIILFKSLQHRKQLFITWFIIGIVLLTGVAVLLLMRYRSDSKKIELKIQELTKLIDESNTILKTDLKSQITDTRSDLEKSIEELKTGLLEQEKKLKELKK